MIVKAPEKSPAAPIPAMALPTISILELVADAQTTEPTDRQNIISRGDSRSELEITFENYAEDAC